MLSQFEECAPRFLLRAKGGVADSNRAIANSPSPAAQGPLCGRTSRTRSFVIAPERLLVGMESKVHARPTFAPPALASGARAACQATYSDGPHSEGAFYRPHESDVDCSLRVSHTNRSLLSLGCDLVVDALQQFQKGATHGVSAQHAFPRKQRQAVSPNPRNRPRGGACFTWLSRSPKGIPHGSTRPHRDPSVRHAPSGIP